MLRLKKTVDNAFIDAGNATSASSTLMVAPMMLSRARSAPFGSLVASASGAAAASEAANNSTGSFDTPILVRTASPSAEAGGNMMKNSNSKTHYHTVLTAVDCRRSVMSKASSVSACSASSNVGASANPTNNSMISAIGLKIRRNSGFSCSGSSNVSKGEPLSSFGSFGGNDADHEDNLEDEDDIGRTNQPPADEFDESAACKYNI